MEVIGSSLAVLWPKFAYCMCTYRVAKGSKGMLPQDFLLDTSVKQKCHILGKGVFGSCYMPML